MRLEASDPHPSSTPSSLPTQAATTDSIASIASSIGPKSQPSSTMSTPRPKAFAASSPLIGRGGMRRLRAPMDAGFPPTRE